MKKSKFEVGQRVGTFFDRDENFTAKAVHDADGDRGPFYGEIKELTGLRAKVMFDDEYLNDPLFDSKTGNPKGYTPAAVATKALVPEADLQVQCSELEQEFKQVEKQVKERLKVAAKEIREANKLAKSLGTSLEEMGAGYGDLYNAMNAAGWRTSSFGC